MQPCSEGFNSGVKRLLLLREVQTFLSGQQCKGNHLLHFHGNNKNFYIVDRHMYDNNKKVTHCCSSMATMVTQMCNNVMWYLHCLSCRKESIFKQISYN